MGSHLLIMQPFIPFLLVSFAYCASLYQIRTPSPSLIDSRVLMIDLDNTLYPRDPLHPNSRRMAAQYLMDKFGYSLEKALDLLAHYRMKYDGMAIHGLVRELGVNAADFENYLFKNSDLAWKLKADLKLREMLDKINSRRYVLTNSGIDHALMVLDALGITQSFHGIIYIDYNQPNFTTKPSPQVYQSAMMLVNVRNPQSIDYLDDDPKFAMAGKKIGWNAWLLDTRRDSRLCPDSNLPCIHSIYDLPTALPMLFV